MNTTRCFSSHLLSKLLEWKNFDPTPNTWGGYTTKSCINYKKYASISQEIVSTAKGIVTEIALPILTTIALLETILYATYYPLEAFLSHTFTSFKASEKAKKLLSSSLFTIIWTIYSMATQIVFSNTYTHESLARYTIFNARFLRPEDTYFLCQNICQIKKDHPSLNTKIQTDLHDALKKNQGQTIVNYIINKYIMHPMFTEAINNNTSKEKALSSISQAVFLITTWIYVHPDMPHGPLACFDDKYVALINNLKKDTSLQEISTVIPAYYPSEDILEDNVSRHLQFIHHLEYFDAYRKETGASFQKGPFSPIKPGTWEYLEFLAITKLATALQYTNTFFYTQCIQPVINRKLE